MNLSQRNRNIILWIIAIGLLVSMVISFTPGTLFGGTSQQEAAEGPVALNVNGEPIREVEIARLEQNPPFNAVQEGPVAEHLERVLLDELATQELLRQAAADVDVSSAEVRTRVNEFREQQGVAGARNDRAYLNLIAGAGYTDATFRELIREQLQQEKYLEGLTEGVTVSDEEVETYYAANQDAYGSEPRITAREIVVEDEEQANLVYARALAGEDFAALARETSTERAEQGGALGAAEGDTPQPVTRVALPAAVADAAFALQGPGLTAPVEAGGAYHIVKVEAFQPAGTRPLDEVHDEVREDVQELKEAAVQENTLRELRESAEITAPEGSTYSFENPTVARVGDAEIRAAELDRNTYLNPQIQGLLNPNFAEIIATSVRPNVLDQLVDEELAYQGAERLGATFVGPRSAVAQSALGYVSRDDAATDAQVRQYYQNNRAAYTEPPSALTTRVNFSDRASARSFREALLGADTITPNAISIAAEAAGGTLQELGNVTPGGQAEAIDAALFDFEDGMEPLGESTFDISRVLTVTTPAPGAQTGGGQTGGAQSGGAGGAGAAPREQFVVLVAARTPERVRPLSEVRVQVEQAATQQRRNEAQQSWLDGLREDIPVENLLAARAAAGAGAQGGGAQGGNAQGGGAQSGGSELLPTPTPPEDDAN